MITPSQWRVLKLSQGGVINIFPGGVLFCVHSHHYRPYRCAPPPHSRGEEDYRIGVCLLLCALNDTRGESRIFRFSVFRYPISGDRGGGLMWRSLTNKSCSKAFIVSDVTGRRYLLLRVLRMLRSEGRQSNSLVAF